MNITYKWKINQLNCKPVLGNMTDYVVNIHWTLEGVDTDSGVESSIYGTTALGENEENPDYISFSDLTEDIIIGWLEYKLQADSKTDYKELVAKQIQDKITPPIINPPLPWSL